MLVKKKQTELTSEYRKVDGNILVCNLLKLSDTI